MLPTIVSSKTHTVITAKKTILSEKFLYIVILHKRQYSLSVRSIVRFRSREKAINKRIHFIIRQYLTGNYLALYIEKGGILGFRPRTRRIDSKTYPTGNVDLSHLDTNIIVLERRTLNLPKTNLQNGQMLFVRNHTNNDQSFIYGRISLGSSQADKYTTITLNGGEMAVLIYDEVNNIWTANKLGHF